MQFRLSARSWRERGWRSRKTEAFRNFDRIYVCSSEDREKLLRARPRWRSACCPMPSASRVRWPEPLKIRHLTFLFIGTLGYYPMKTPPDTCATRLLPPIQALGGAPTSG